jgi:hypothetical protein
MVDIRGINGVNGEAGNIIKCLIAKLSPSHSFSSLASPIVTHGFGQAFSIALGCREILLE